MLKNNLWECVFQRRTDTREPHWGIECLKVMAEFKLDTAAAVDAWGELQAARLLRQRSLALPGGKEKWLQGCKAMNDQLKDAQEHLQRMGLVV